MSSEGGNERPRKPRSGGGNSGSSSLKDMMARGSRSGGSSRRHGSSTSSRVSNSSDGGGDSATTGSGGSKPHRTTSSVSGSVSGGGGGSNPSSSSRRPGSRRHRDDRTVDSSADGGGHRSNRSHKESSRSLMSTDSGTTPPSSSRSKSSRDREKDRERDRERNSSSKSNSGSGTSRSHRRRKEGGGGERSSEKPRSSRHRSKSSANSHGTTDSEDLDLAEAPSSATDFGDAAAFDSNAFGASDTFAAFDNNATGAFGASSGAFENSAFDSGAFDTTPTLPATKTTNTSSSAADVFGSSAGGEFGAGFSDFGSDFPATSSSSGGGGNDDAAAFGGGGGGGFDAFGGSSFPTSKAPAKTTRFDTSPIDDPPIAPETIGLPAPCFELQESRPILMQKSPATASPVANPLTGNIIMVRPKPKPIWGFSSSSSSKNSSVEWQLVEWNATTQTQVLSAPLLSQDLQRKVTQKFNVTIGGVDSILTLATGVHHVNGFTRTRVASLLDLLVVEQTQSKREVLRVVAIWQWGYGTNQLCQLQTVLSPPSGSDFTYNPTSLLVADSCVFISGASQKGPCVFLSKPTVKATWSANFVGKEASRIASMALIPSAIHPEEPGKIPTTDSQTPQPPRIPYLAIALTDGSVAVWTYEAATKVTNKTTESVRRLLYPLCKLDGVKILRQATPSLWDPTDPGAVAAAKEIGYCTHLEWVAPRPCAHNQLLLLTAAFQGGLCVYHVALPKVQGKSSYVDMKPPTEKTQLSQTYTIKPFGIIRWPKIYHYSCCSFCDLGPHLPPSFSVMVTGLDSEAAYARLGLVTCPLPVHGSLSSSSSTIPLQIWDSLEFVDISHKIAPRGLIPCSTSTSGIVYHTDTQLRVVPVIESSTLVPSRGGIGSLASGLTTSGGMHWPDASEAEGDKAGILQIYTTLHCERKKSETYLEWTPPTRRHWLIQTKVGDCKNAASNDAQREEKEDMDEIVTTGTVSSVVCELRTDSFGGPLTYQVPYRLLRHPTYPKIAAVWFRPLTSNQDQQCLIGIVDLDPDSGKYTIVRMVEGRDLAFLPNLDDGTAQCLVLSSNGGSVALWEKKPKWRVKEGAPYFRPIVGSDEGEAEKYVDCQRIFSSIDQKAGVVTLLAVGYQASNDSYCLVKGPTEATKGLLWTRVLPSMATQSVFWLEPQEGVVQVIGLPSEGSIAGGYGIITSKRVMVLSPDLLLLGSQSVRVPPSSLVVMGSYTVAFVSQDDYKVCYVSGVPGPFGASGVLLSLPLPQFDYNPNSLLAIRPDRFIYTPYHMGVRLVERGQDSHTILLPTAVTRPALLLEPMIANAIATGGTEVNSQPFLRTVVERFGRKASTMTHGENEGVGNLGAGITPRVFELLDFYNLNAAASWLLTGTTRFDRSANSRLLPSWMPVNVKVKGAVNMDTHLHVIANGDQYFSEYLKSPDTNMTATLPRPSEPSSVLSQGFANAALEKGDTLDAMKMLDVVGTEAAETMLLELSLALQGNSGKNPESVLKSLYESDAQIGKATDAHAVASLAALAVELKEKGTADDAFNKQWIRSLAPSIQKGRKVGRMRPRIIGESAFESIEKASFPADRLFSSEINEARLVWNDGPNREKENLLMLGNIEEWFGRYRPVILGKEGVKAAEDQGANILADILAQPDDDSFGGDEDDQMEDGWVEGVGEGQKSEDKLSAYYRFSEGEDEDSGWREEGFVDISKFEVRAVLVGCNDTATLQESTSSVDEGDPGKVKAIFDLVFEQSGIGVASALAMPASRGGSLDVGMMHGPDHTSRQKCSIEFWFWVPESIQKEIILSRRTFGSSADDLENVCKASESSSALWELVLSKSGELEFRTAAGGKIRTEPKPTGDDDEDDEPKPTIQFSRWNHVCVTIKQEETMASAVNLLVKGSTVGSKSLNFKPPNFEEDEFAGASGLDSVLQKSYLVFGLNHPASFRLTEMRVWSMERDDDDIRTMMTEYLEPAEIKRKFRVKIKKKGGDGGAKLGIVPTKGGLATAGGLAPPKGGLTPPPSGGLQPPKGTLAPPGEGKERPKPASKRLLAPPKGKEDAEKIPAKKPADDFGGFGDAAPMETMEAPAPAVAADLGFGGDAFGSFGDAGVAPAAPSASFESGFGETGRFPADTGPTAFESIEEPEVDEYDEMEISPLWDSAIPLSEQVRSSAAAALIRGPPATRHFGGNRGGLPDYRELERFGVGAISICGSEKTIVWRDDQVPPGLTYPIGASGAIVSDQMDEDGSEFLCCFLAKDKRMVVFELSTRTVVVELQMTTKLNYWRFLPPEAAEDTLCFMLVTPVGGFHWMPLDESPRPRQVWKRGPELQGKKIVSYEEGGTNGLDGPDMLSKVGMLLVTNASAGGRLESWLVPICGDSQALCASDDMLGACLCRPPDIGYEAWMPLLLFVVESEEGDLIVCISAITEASESSIGLTDVMTDALIEMAPYEGMDYEPPTLAMGTWPEVLCCSLGSTIVVVARRTGLVVAYELADTGLELIAQENVGHYVVDAVMRYSAVEGGAEIVLLMSDSEHPRDGRVGTFCFRTAG